MRKKQYFHKIILSLSSSIFALLLIELALRIYFAIKIGPDVFLYGTRFTKSFITVEDYRTNYRQNKHNVALHKNIKIIDSAKDKQAASPNFYSKYYPHQKRIDTDIHGKSFNVLINNLGFRGKEIKRRKAVGTLRIICLGASSTFGYGNRDNETYPYFLEKILNERIKNNQIKSIKSVEVINLGIPHLDSKTIYLLFINEGLPLNPDIVTFYEGANDAAFLQIHNPNWKSNIFYKARSIYRFLQIKKYSLTVKLFRDWYVNYKRTFSKESYRKYLKGKSDFFINNLSLINKACLYNRIKLYIITQQLRTSYFSNTNRKGVSYQQEVNLVKEKIEKEDIAYEELILLVHSNLMDSERKWAAENNVRLIDGIKALDNERDALASWVHLTHRGNYLLAEEIADSLWKTNEYSGNYIGKETSSDQNGTQQKRKNIARNSEY